MPYRKSFLTIWALLLLNPTEVLADELSTDRISLAGFGTLGAVYNGSDEAEFVRDISQFDGVKDGWSGNVDSRLGLQLSIRASNDWDLIAQGVSRYDSDGHYDPELTWAFLRYSPDPDVQLRLGRVGLDSYMLADSKDVGYSYLWIRPPVEYYGHRHFSYIDGGDFTFKRPLGEGLAWVKLYAGQAEAETSIDFIGGDQVQFDASGEVVGGHINYAIGPWHFQVSHSRLEYELEGPPGYVEFVDQLRAFQPAFAEALSTWMRPIDMKLSSVGLAYADGPLQVQAMVNQLDQEIDLNDTDSAFVTVAYRVGNVTPFLTWSGSRTEGISYREMGLPAIDGDYGMSQSAVGLGGRYDFSTNMALKLQYDYVDVEQSGVIWRNTEPGWKGDVSLFSLGLDFVF